MTIKKNDIAPVQSIEFVNKFGENVSKLLEALHVHRVVPMPIGSNIKTYKSTVTLADNTAVGEGELIPLSQVKREVAENIELGWKKYRKQSSAELIQQVGFDRAILETDLALMKEVQKGVRADLFANLAKGTKTMNASGLKQAFAKAWGAVQTVFEDDAAETVAFANPLDIANYIADDTNLQQQTAFGLTYVTGFTGVSVVIVNTSVPQGTVYATAPENLVLAHAEMSGGEVGKAFDLYSDESGILSITHMGKADHMAFDTIISGALAFFAERLDGVVKITLGTSEEGEEVTTMSAKTTKAKK